MSTIALNATMLNSKSGGIGVYIRNLVQHLDLLQDDQKVKILAGLQADELVQTESKNVEIVRLNCDSQSPIRRIVSEYFSLPKALSQNKIDLFHSPISYIPSGVNVPAIVTVHDLRYFHYPETYTKLRGKFLEKMIPRSVQKAKSIIAVSEYTKSDLVRLFGISPDKIFVIHEGVNRNAFERPYYENEWKTIQKRYALPDRYILSVGHLEPRKNFVRLLQAFSILRDQFDIDIKLVIVGQENWYYEQIYNKSRDLALDEHVVFTGFVKDKELAAFYQNAEVCVAPSLFEGFGFTPLEAQAAGTAVVASTSTSHPEILGDSALFFDPMDVETMAEKTSDVLLNQDIKDELVKKGLENIKRFDWRTACDNTFKLYR